MSKTIFLFFSCFVLLASTTQAQTVCPNPVDPNCKWNAAKNCWGKAQFNGICPDFEVPYPYYTSFTDSGDFFNKPIGGVCQPWKLQLNQSNCCENLNFNMNSECVNDSTSPYPWSTHPRLQLLPGGRKGGNDKFAKVATYPGDDLQTSPYNTRSEINIGPEVKEGQRRFYSWSFRFPTDWVDDDVSFCPNYDFNHYFIMQIHPHHGIAYNCADQVPVIIFNYFYSKANGTRFIKVLYGSACGGTTPMIGTIPIRLGKWYDVILDVNWTTNPDMTKKTFTLQAYSGSTVYKKINGYGPNLYKDILDTTQTIMYKIKLGLYRGKYHCTSHHIDYDEFSMAKTRYGLISPQVPAVQTGILGKEEILFSDQQEEESEYLIYYSKQSDHIHLQVADEYKAEELVFRLYDVTGKLAGTYMFNGGGEYAVERNGLPNGIYFYSATSRSGDRHSKGKLMLY